VGGWRETWTLRKKLIVWGCTALACIIVLAASGFAVVWNHLNGNIKTEGADLKPVPMDGKQDVLFIGSDSRAGANQALGGGTVIGARSDTAMVFDSPADRRKGTEVSIPRDSMVQIPDCTGSNGQTVASSFGMFNSAFTIGGAPCTVSTVESLTGLPLTHYIVVDFEGVVGVVNALGGVKVCLTAPVHDRDSGLNLPAGTTTLNGQQALAFVRVRHTVGDGSDLERIQRQQYFIDQFSSQVRADGLLTDPIKLYNVLNAATSAIQTDPGLGSVSALYGLAQTLNTIPSGKMTYVTVPNEPYAGDPNRVTWSEPAATNLWDGLINEPDSPTASATSAALGLRSGPGGDDLFGLTGQVPGLRAPMGPQAPTSGPQVPTPGSRVPGSRLGPMLGPSSLPVRIGMAASTDTGMSVPWANVGATPDQVRAAESLGALESLMRLALMADTPSDTSDASGSSARAGDPSDSSTLDSSDAPSAAANGTASGTTKPLGVGTCAVR
jgi:LCP family protein required for cell wall assembly